MARPLNAQPARAAPRPGPAKAGWSKVAVVMAYLRKIGWRRRPGAGPAPRGGSGVGRRGLLGHGRRGSVHVHPHRLPDMAVEILEAAAVHEAVILLLARLAAAGGER